MVYLTRRAGVKSGKFREAITWAKEVAEFVNNKYGTSFNVYSQIYGDQPVGTVFWVSKYESRSKIEEVANKLGEDQEYMGRLQGFAELFVEGTTHDSVLEKH